MCLGSSEANSKEKTSVKSKYLVKIEMGALFTTNAAISALQKKWISPFWLGLSKEATCTTKVLYLRSRAAAVNSFFPTSSTRLMVEKAFSMV